MLQPMLVEDRCWEAQKAIKNLELDTPFGEGPRLDFTHLTHEEGDAFLEGSKRLNALLDIVATGFSTIEQCPIGVPMNIDGFIEKNREAINECIDDILPALTTICSDPMYKNHPKYAADVLLNNAVTAIDAMFVALNSVLNYHNWRSGKK